MKEKEREKDKERECRKSLEEMVDEVDGRVKERLSEQEDRLAELYLQAKEDSGKMVEEMISKFKEDHIKQMLKINAIQKNTLWRK